MARDRVGDTSTDTGDVGRPKDSMKTFTVSIDGRLDRTLDELKDELGKSSRADVFRLAIALLKVATDAHRRGEVVALADSNGQVKREIVLPG
jgi:metal-responsive CopG/Arc/MetJ family transcriptional regulator